MNTGNFFIDSLPHEIKQRLSFQLQLVKLAKHDHLYLQGQKVDSIYFPLSAIISKYQTSADGHTIEVALTGKEGVVGLTSAFDSRESMNSCQVCIGGSAMKIRVDFLMKILEAEPGLEAAMMHYIDAQVKQMSRRLLCNRFHSVEQRFCTWLLLVAERRGKPRVRITHADAARALGVHRPTITETTRILCEKKIIAQSNAAIAINDLDQVKELACECLADLSIAKKAVPARRLNSKSAA